MGEYRRPEQRTLVGQTEEGEDDAFNHIAYV
jgi:hypothetical protein